MSKRIHEIRTINHKPVKQGELVYIEDKRYNCGVWCQKLPVNHSDGKTKNTYYITLQDTNMFSRITCKSLDKSDISYKSEYIITKTIRSGENVAHFISNRFNQDCDYIDNLKINVDYDEYYSASTSSYQMHKIKEETFKKIITCISGTKHGEVREKCNECGGKGTRRKSFKKFVIKKRDYDCGKIDYDSKNRKLRFYDKHDSSSFYFENTRVYFLYSDAVKKCEELNVENGYL